MTTFEQTACVCLTDELLVINLRRWYEPTSFTLVIFKYKSYPGAAGYFKTNDWLKLIRVL